MLPLNFLPDMFVFFCLWFIFSSWQFLLSILISRIPCVCFLGNHSSHPFLATSLISSTVLLAPYNLGFGTYQLGSGLQKHFWCTYWKCWVYAQNHIMETGWPCSPAFRNWAEIAFYSLIMPSPYLYCHSQTLLVLPCALRNPSGSTADNHSWFSHLPVGILHKTALGELLEATTGSECSACVTLDTSS